MNVYVSKWAQVGRQGGMYVCLRDCKPVFNVVAYRRDCELLQVQPCIEVCLYAFILASMHACVGVRAHVATDVGLHV